MHPDGSLNLAQVSPIVERLITQRASALYVCGATGEGVSLTREERMAVAESYLQAVAGRIPVVVQVGHDSLHEARWLAAHAQANGASAISAIPPCFFKVDRLEILLDCWERFAPLHRHAFYYYHIPRLTATRFDVVELLRMSITRLPDCVG